MIKVRMNKFKLAKYRLVISAFSSQLGLKNDVVISIHLQDFETFELGKQLLPFYKNVYQKELLLWQIYCKNIQFIVWKRQNSVLLHHIKTRTSM
jgi:hypothetical protein